MQTFSPEILALAGSALTFLLSGNIYFIKRLVNKLEHTVSANETSSKQIVELKQTVLSLLSAMSDLKADIKDLRRIEIDVAVLRAKMNPAKVENLSTN